MRIPMAAVEAVATGALVLAPTAALAVKPAPTTPTIALATGVPALGSSVTFTVQYPNTVKNPVIAVDCYQSGAVVWSFVGGVGDAYLLGGDSSPWRSNGGSASCVADLENETWHAGVESFTQLAETSFTATG
jgi:hypothetical protein